ncbi:Ff.00g000060.m01.CDS01 [Fusarium sp. VM40]|nr:Ff.00g000060.m01.CDS01 [Fusarium sp. VM40]
MAQQDNNTGYPIYLYTTPTLNQNHFYKRTVDIIGHWAICINGYCYELTRVTPSERQNLGIQGQYQIRSLTEQDWKKKKRGEERRIKEREPVGYTSRPWSHETIKRIADLIWKGPLQGTYVYDRNNCQVFVRLLVELVGNRQVMVKFPAFFNEKVKEAGIARDMTYFAMTGFVIGGGSMAAGMSLLVTPGDPTGIMGACAVAAGGAALHATKEVWESRINKDNFIWAAQQNLRAELMREGTLW